VQATDSEVKELRDLILGMDKKMDVFIARTDERFNSIETQITDFKKSTDTQLADIKTQLKTQDARIWTLMISSLSFFGYP
jgi:HD-GYP domain-containing protein (c-di-GMP phosphodiesterase class II)